MTAGVADIVAGGLRPDTTGRVCGDESTGLVLAARAGDVEAFGRLVDLHERSALRTAMAALRRREDAEDVVQEAFVLAWQRLATFRQHASFRTWLHAIVWRRALDRRKSRDRWWRRSSADGDDALPATLVAETLDPEAQMVDGRQRQAVARAIAVLPAALKDALLLAATGEHTYEEIARLQGVRPGTVKWRVFEARRLVRARLERKA